MPKLPGLDREGILSKNVLGITDAQEFIEYMGVYAGIPEILLMIDRRKQLLSQIHALWAARDINDENASIVEAVRGFLRLRPGADIDAISDRLFAIRDASPEIFSSLIQGEKKKEASKPDIGAGIRQILHREAAACEIDPAEFGEHEALLLERILAERTRGAFSDPGDRKDAQMAKEEGRMAAITEILSWFGNPVVDVSSDESVALGIQGAIRRTCAAQIALSLREEIPASVDPFAAILARLRMRFQETAPSPARERLLRVLLSRLSPQLDLSQEDQIEALVTLLDRVLP